MKYFILFAICILFSSITAYSQESLDYESKVADLGEIQMEYMDFGGDGPVLIWVQDFHNYFEGPYKDPRYYSFFKELSTEYRVLAPLRCGYGKSTERKWGYDVATQSMDLLHFMDALKIDKAVLYGRVPGNQEMTWIAEYHPERLSGLIYIGNPTLIVECSRPEIIEYVENWCVYTPDFSDKEKMRRIVLSRALWRPNFISDSLKRIDVPSIRFIHPKRNSTNQNLEMFKSGIVEELSKESIPGKEEEQRYFQDLLQDSIRYEKLHKSLIECNPSGAIEEGMKRAFGKNLITIWDENEVFFETGLEAYLQWELKNILAFKSKIKQ